MPGPLLTKTSLVSCAHSAPAQAMAVEPRVTILGQPVATGAAPHSVIGCPNMVGTTKLPCQTVLWSTTATRVLANGKPVLLEDSEGMAVETGTPVNVMAGHVRVTGI